MSLRYISFSSPFYTSTVAALPFSGKSSTATKSYTVYRVWGRLLLSFLYFLIFLLPPGHDAHLHKWAEDILFWWHHIFHLQRRRSWPLKLTIYTEIWFLTADNIATSAYYGSHMISKLFGHWLTSEEIILRIIDVNECITLLNLHVIWLWNWDIILVLAFDDVQFLVFGW